jgi:hypothetical protein
MAGTGLCGIVMDWNASARGATQAGAGHELINCSRHALLTVGNSRVL